MSEKNVSEEFYKNQVKYIPEYLEGLKNTDDPVKALQRILLDNLEKYKFANKWLKPLD